MAKNVVVIPVYKADLSEKEKASLAQCLAVLSKHEIALACPDSLDLSGYRIVFEQFDKKFVVKRFPSCYFENIASYNKMMLDKDFYSAFQEYNYMLVYQLDAYVYRDEFSYWCESGYDYIGAPYLLDAASGITAGSRKLIIGNGGFSLRKIKRFTEMLEIKGNVLSVRGLIKINSNSPWWKIIPLVILGLFGYKNTIQYFQTGYKHNEDTVWSCLAYHSRHNFRAPDFYTAIRFAWEKDAAYLRSLNNNQLPFGCHAWGKYE